MLAQICAVVIVGFARAITAVRGIWAGSDPAPVQRIYYANHASHGDFVLIWTVLPRAMRARTRPVAGSDYWLASRLRAFIGREVFRAVLIDRNPETRQGDPVAQMGDALKAGESLIIFPEGTRNTGEDPLLPFKSGLYHLAAANPEVDMVPVWIANLNRVMPKGALVPIPLICTVTFGAPLRLEEGEEKGAFLVRAREALLALSPQEDA
ncbi:lysophospholipid acyltransferase family protein [Roseovarius sp. S1116L3]|uniref:lysophospholipid acyltransferase family protein n=1 Tax=Roseovarius roseus TaxID=3342636 RepID=UPI003726F192